MIALKNDFNVSTTMTTTTPKKATTKITNTLARRSWLLVFLGCAQTLIKLMVFWLKTTLALYMPMCISITPLSTYIRRTSTQLAVW